MKRISIVVLAALIAIVCAQEEFSQAQKRKPTRSVKPTPTPVPDMRAEASQVATQIKNVTNFIYVYGKIVNSLEVADEQVKNKQTSPEIQALNQKSKDALILRIRDLRAGLDNLAKSFKANQRLQVQYLKLNYATDAALNAERLATAGRYEEAGKTLVQVIERLTDTVISMRLL
ncbi:MAG TPA: hypothetical protein VJ810_04450 [Blastocatellia bacterium]|nr:hypothetical protein [Blastocatellia bacterium]